MGKLIGKVNNKNNSSSGKVIGHIAPQSLENLLLREQEEALQEAQQNAVKTASRYQAMTIHERKLQEKEKKDAAAKLYGPPTPFTVKELQNRVRKYEEKGSGNYDQMRADKKYVDNYISNLEKIVAPSDNDKAILGQLKNISSVFNSELYLTDEEKNNTQTEIADLEAKLKKAEKLKKKASDLENKTGAIAPPNSPKIYVDSPETSEFLLAEKEFEDYLKSIGYADIGKLKDEITSKKTFLHEKKRISKLTELSDVALSSDDFETKSAVVSNSSDIIYNYINDIDGFRHAYEDAVYADLYDPAYYITDNITAAQLDAFMAKNALKPLLFDSNFEHLTNEEIKIYNFYYSTKGPRKAQEYLDSLQQDLNIRSGTEMYERQNSNFTKLLFGAAAGLDQFEEGLKNVFNTKDEYIATSDYQVASSLVREDLAEQGWGWKLGYDFINTAANMGPSILASTIVGYINPYAGAAVGSALMGGSAAGNAYQEMLNMGYDKSQARVYSTAVGLSEAALSMALSGIGKLGGLATNNVLSKAISGVDNAFAKWAIEYGGKVLSEGLEEGLQEILDPIFKSWATNTTLEYWGGVNWGDVLYSALLGGLSAGLFEVAPGTVKTIAANRNAKNLYGGSQKELVAQARELSDGTDAKRLGDKYQKKLDKGKNLSGAQLRQLVEANEEAFTQEDKVRIQAAAELRLGQLGEKGNKTNLAEAIAKTVVGEKLTFTEKSLIENSQYGNRVINEAMPDNVTSGNYASDWARKIGTERLNADVYNIDTVDSSLQHNGNSDIISTVGESNGIFEKRTVGQTSGYNGGRTQSVERGRQEILSNDSARAQGVAASTGQRHTVNYKNSSVNYIEAASDKNDGYKAYLAFRSAGIKAIYCDGDIIRNVNGVDIVRTEAFTAPDGTVYISNKSTLPAKEIYDHERVHVADFINEKAYSDYEDIVCNNLDYESDSYAQRAKQLNEGQFGGKYDIFNPDNARYFIKEFCAYINQYVLSDPSYAQELFGGMFRDWSAVTAAVEKFNKDMGADFSESAFSMPSDTSSAQSGSNLTQEQKNLNAVLSAATSGMKRSYPLQQNNAADSSSALQNGESGSIINSRGDIDGSTNSELLERGRVLSTTGEVGNGVRQRGGNPTANSRMLGDVVKTKRGDRGTVSAGESGWMAVQKHEPDTHKSPRLREGLYRRLSRINLKKIDSAGRILSDDLIAELNDTIFKDENGKIISLFHWTPNIFDVFKYGDIGFHLGTLRAALDKRGGSEQFLKDNSFVGNCKEVYCNMKNPVFMKDYTGIWEVAYANQLVEQDIITQAEYDSLKNLKGFRNSQYSDEASVKFRELLESKGYDGIIYTNEHEDPGNLSVIVFHPEQIITVVENGVLKENSGVTEATSDTEVASFAPENERSEIFESGEENNTPENKNPDSEDFGEDFEGERIALDEPDIHNPKVEWIDSFADELIGNKRKSEGQALLFRAAKKLGWKIGFSDVFVKDKSGNIIYDESGNPKRANSKVNKAKKEIVFDYECENPIRELIFHELTHFLETNITAYQDFANAVMNSKVFKEWVNARGYSSTSKFNDQIQKDYKGTKGFEEVGSEKAENSANLELVANFVAEKLFSDEQKMMERLVNEINPEHRTTLKEVITRIFEKLKTAFTGTAQQKQIAKLEEKWLKTYKKAESTWQEIKTSQEQKNTIKDGDVKYSIVSDSLGKYVKVEANQEIFNGKSTREMQEIARKIIRDNFKGQVLTVGESGKAYINKHSSDEYAYPANRRMAENIKQSKMRASAELDNLLAVSQFVENQEDDGRHPSATGGWDVYTTRFEIGDTMFSGEVKIMVTDRGYVFYDITKIKRLSVNGGQTETNSAAASDSLPTDSITDNKSSVNSNSMQNEEEYSISTKIDMADILGRVERGEMSAKEAEVALSGNKTQTPFEIAYTTDEDAYTTPPLSRKTGEAKGDKESNTYESLLESDIFDEDFKAEVKTDDFIRKYQSVTNKETLRTAAKELDEGGRAYVEKWWALSPERANLIDTAVGFILMDRYQRIGNYESAIAVAEKVREFGTASGQQVQIFSILGRLDANSMVVYAQRELEKAYESMVEKRSKRWISKNAERFNLTEEEIEFIRRHTIQAAQLPEGRDKAIRLAEIATLLQNKLPPERGQGFRALQRISMLLNGKTNIRNFTGNGIMVPVFIASDFFGSGIDRWVSKKTGVRTTGNFDIKSVKGFKKGVFETMDDFRRHINTRNEELNRYDIGSGKSFNENHKGKLAKQLNDCAKVLNALDRFTSFCLEMGDRPFYEMWYINSLNNQLKLNKTEEATPEIIAIASLEALQRTWQDSNKVVEAVKNSKKALNTINIWGYGLGDVMVKFVKTPANLTKAIFDFSPAGAIKALSADAVTLKNAIETGQFEAKMQKDFVNNLSKGITGTLIYVLAAALAARGLLRGKDDEDKDTANFERYIQGQPEYSIKIFGKWYTYDWAQPVGAIFAAVGDYMENKNQNPDNQWYEDILEAIKAGGEVLYNQSFMQSIQGLFTADSVVDGLIDSALGEPSVFVPQLVSQFANITDEYRRVTYEYNKPFETALNKVKVKIPWLRKTLEKQVDVLGRDVPNSQKNIFNAFFNPGNTYTDTSNEVSDEVYRVYTSTGEKSVIPRKAPYYVTVKGIKRSFSAEETADFQRIMGQTASDILDEAFDSINYEKLNDMQKAEFISDVYSYASAKAKSSFVYSREVLAAVEGEDIITQKWYDKASDKSKKAIMQEYFMSNYKKVERYVKNGGSAAEYFIAKAK